MGLDVTAYLVVGVPYKDAFEHRAVIKEIEKKDKRGNSYIEEVEEEELLFFGNPVDDEYEEDIAEEHGMMIINGELPKVSFVGVPITSTKSHRGELTPIHINHHQLQKDVANAFEVFKKLGCDKAMLCLVQDASV